MRLMNRNRRPAARETGGPGRLGTPVPPLFPARRASIRVTPIAPSWLLSAAANTSSLGEV